MPEKFNFSTIWNFLENISPILWISFVFSIIVYIGNRIQKGIEIDKDIELIQVELEEYNPEKLLTRSSGSPDRMEYGEMVDIYEKKKREDEVRIKYLKKLKKYRWFFIKKFE